MPSESVAKVRQVFSFLKAFAERNVPVRRRLAEQPWSLRFSELPEHPTIEIGSVLIAPPEAANTGNDPVPAEEAPPLLRVRRPRTTEAPTPPPEVRDWLRPGWRDPDQRVDVVSPRNVVREDETTTEEFSDDPARLTAFDGWLDRRERWAVSERPARAAMRIFERLYDAKARIGLESERVELMLGDGRLRWRGASGETDHPVLLQRVELEFDPEVPEVRIVDSDRPPELYLALLQDGVGISPDTYRQLREEVESGAYHPLAGDPTTGFLTRLIRYLSPRGEVLDRPAQGPISEDPTISREPALFLRLRVSGFPAAFERVLEDLHDRETLPASLTRLVGVVPPPPRDPEPEPQSPWGEPHDVLLSKPANVEQIHVARALARHKAVLVQGPPGTGKSHTIANLIGHLVAGGQRVLVTSHATKALRVLREHLVENLRPLCVSVLETDLDARREIEAAVKGTLSRLTTAHKPTLEREAGELAQRRSALNAEVERLTDELRAIREGEYRPILVGGEAYEPVEAARWVAEHAGLHDWIPGALTAGVPLPLGAGEAGELYASSADLSSEDELELASGVPDVGAVPTPERITALLEALREPRSDDDSRWWPRSAASSDLMALLQLRDALAAITADLSTLAPWQRTVVAAGHSGGAERQLWDGLYQMVQDAWGRWETARPLLLDYEPQVDDDTIVDGVHRTLSEIIRHIEAGKGLGAGTLLFHPSWKRIIQGARINGRSPSQAAHFRVLGTYVLLVEGRKRLATRWARQAEPAGLPGFERCGDPPEAGLRDYAEQFPELLRWWDARWGSVSDLLRGLGFRWDRFRAHAVAPQVPMLPFERDAALASGPLLSVIEARLIEARRVEAVEALTALDELLAEYGSQLASALRQSVRRGDSASYQDAYWRLSGLHALRPIYERRCELLGRLDEVAPEWANAIRTRQDPHGGPATPGDPPLAWQWGQLRQELVRRARQNERRVAEKLSRRRDELRETTAELIDRLAWLGQKRRIGLAETQALQGWADTQRRIGRGTGRRVPQLQAEARKLLGKARDAVPVWIMPLTRVAESFDPQRDRFDVVIIDEASQADLTALLCWYLADAVLVVGDHEQVSPLAVGQSIEVARTLITEHLAGIPNSHLYDGKTSLYDVARQCFGGVIALREHFRCVPDIIEFSNQLSYDGQIRPLRSPASAPLPHVAEFVVGRHLGRLRHGKTSEAEARAVAALVAAAEEIPEYDGQTMGAITLLGDEQAGLIQDLTVALVGAIKLERRRFAAGNAAQFQGDERDVVFLSMVHSPTGDRLAMIQADLYKQRFNVAASRARDQLWLVHALDPGRDLQEGDLRRRLIEHVRDPGAVRAAIDAAQQRAESPFEREVIGRLVRAGYRVRPQVSIGSYRVDMMVGAGSTRVVVECDGDRFHGPDRIPADMARQAVLERAGWRFVRVRGTRFYRDPDRTMRWLFDELARLGVTPEHTHLEPEAPTADPDDLRSRMVRLAYAIMREQGWVEPAEPELALNLGWEA